MLKNQCRNLRFLVLSCKGEQNKDRTHWHVAYGDVMETMPIPRYVFCEPCCVL